MLFQASRIGHDGIVRILLEWGVDVNLSDGHKATAMIWASGSSRHIFLAASGFGSFIYLGLSYVKHPHFSLAGILKTLV
jgi:hypothetical protein